MAGNANAQEIWLNYFNNTLYEKGIISKNDRDKMSRLIRTRCHTPNRVDRSYKRNLKEIY